MDERNHVGVVGAWEQYAHFFGCGMGTPVASKINLLVWCEGIRCQGPPPSAITSHHIAAIVFSRIAG